ncbi:hypothetical protein CBW65_02525 [Tumebacillus avium]|uniref:Uncharacterized protein n=1 Tax=Tumebacillus avium TaxID=1903704 RepID=A0A1Y0IKU7_9BACL|nr:hypothetical protein [Tumebacillus avium]ARU60063.1 hypothetical protein CBW65_02525 [Tumebacillus avium]
MNQKWVSVVGVVVVLGLSLLLGNAFSGAPASEPVSAPVQDGKPVLKEPEQVKMETDFVTGVQLRGVTARTATMTDVDGSVLPGIEYVVELELPRRLVKFVAENRFEVRAAVSGKTMQYLGSDQFHANSFRIMESNPTYLVYQVNLINYYSATFDTAQLDDVVSRSNEDLQISFYVDRNKVKDF